MLKRRGAMNLRRIALVIYAVYIQQAWLWNENIGFVGQSVILKSSANLSWNLAKVQWSIYDNTTYIASLKDGEISPERFWRHRGRLELNKKTGDLTIKNLIMNDSMMYTVDLTASNNFRKENKVYLQVQERLKKPTITQELNYLKDGQCHILLKCDPFDKNVQLSWTPSDLGSNGSYISVNTTLAESFLWTSFGVNRNVTFNCTASSSQQSEAQQITVGCTEIIKIAKTCSSCSCAYKVFLWIFLYSIAVVFGVLVYVCRGKLKAAYDDCPLHVYQSLFKC